jgi:hypothetical protein
MTAAMELRAQADKVLQGAVDAGHATRDGNRYDGRGKEFCEAWNRAYALRKQARKLELAQEPRCELCTRRGSWNVAGVLLCGAHKKKAKTGHARQMVPLGFMGMIAKYDRRDVIRWAKGEAL